MFLRLRKQPFFVLFLLLVGILLAAPQKSTRAQSPTSEVVQLVNQLRASYGLAGYTWNAQLAVAAQNHANWMASTGLYSHTGAGGSSPYTRAVSAGYNGYVAENIVGGTNLTPQQGVTWWINSPIHFNTLISNQHIEVGVGFAAGQGQNMYVLVAGHPDNNGVQARANAAPQEDTPGIYYVAPIVLSTPQEDGSIVHAVGSGQSLWSIAARYGVTLQEIMLYNGLNEQSTINPGDELIIRLADGAPPPPTATPPTTYKVQSGDSAWTIAARFRISLDDFLWFNSMAEEDPLQPGDTVTIRIPEGEPLPPTPTPQLTHRVRAGQTLWDIAVEHGLALDELLALNGMTTDSVISIGQEIFIRTTPNPPTAIPPTYTPIATGYPGEIAAAISVPDAAPETTNPAPETATPTPTSLPQAVAAVGGQPAGVPPLVGSAKVANTSSILTLGVGVFFLVIAIVLLATLVILAIRHLSSPQV